MMKNKHTYRVTFLTAAVLMLSLCFGSLAAVADDTPQPSGTYLKTGLSGEGVTVYGTGITWDSEEKCAVFDGSASYIEIQNPFANADFNTGFTILFEAYIDSANNGSGKYTRLSGEEASKNGWQRIFEVNDGSATNKKYFDINAGTGQTSGGFGGSGSSSGTSGHLCVEFAINGSSNKTQVKRDDQEITYFDEWHEFCLVVSPGGYTTLYVDDIPVSWKESDAKIKDILDSMGTFSRSYIGTSGFEVNDSNKDGFFTGKMRNLVFYDESIRASYNGTGMSYRLDFDSQGGSDADSMTVSAIPTASELPKPTKAGADFAGWFTDPECTVKAAAGVPLTGNTTLYAGWHVHQWEYDFVGAQLIVKCVTIDPCKCDNYVPDSEEPSLRTSIAFDEEHLTSSSTYVSAENKSLFTDAGFEVEMTYTNRDTEGAASSSRPTADGRYTATLKITDPSGEVHELTRTFIINESHDVIPGAAEEDALGDMEASLLSRTGGYINYTARDHVIVYSDESETSYIDLTDELLHTDIAVAYYTLDGKSWKAGNLDIVNAQLSKKMSSGFALKVATDSFDAKKKRPTDDATIRTFAKIGKRPATDKFVVNYNTCRDDYGLTNGQWCLTKSKSNALQTLEGYEIGICDDGKKIGSKGYGIWPEEGGVWVSALPENGKAGKEVYLYRKMPSGTTPAGKAVKITVSTIQAAPKMKVDYKNESIKIKKEMNIYFGAALPTFAPEAEISIPKLNPETKSYYGFYQHAVLRVTDSQAKKAMSIAPYITGTRNSIILWQSANQKKPASAKQVITLAARKSVPTVEECVTFSKGAAKLQKGYEVYDTKTKKWKTSLPKATKDTVVIVRFKADAKAGAENDTSFANGREGLLTLHYGVFDETLTKNNKGFVSGTIEAK